MEDVIYAENVEIKHGSIGKFDRFEMFIKHEELDFIGYEFSLNNGIYVEESECMQYLFRMDVDKESNEITVYSAYSQDYDVMEDVTSYFDVDTLKEKLLDHVAGLDDQDEYNHGNSYVEYLEE